MMFMKGWVFFLFFLLYTGLVFSGDGVFFVPSLKGEIHIEGRGEFFTSIELNPDKTVFNTSYTYLFQERTKGWKCSNQILCMKTSLSPSIAVRPYLFATSNAFSIKKNHKDVFFQKAGVFNAFSLRNPFPVQNFVVLPFSAVGAFYEIEFLVPFLPGSVFGMGAFYDFVYFPAVEFENANFQGAGFSFSSRHRIGEKVQLFHSSTFRRPFRRHFISVSYFPEERFSFGVFANKTEVIIPHPKKPVESFGVRCCFSFPPPKTRKWRRKSSTRFVLKDWTHQEDNVFPVILFDVKKTEEPGFFHRLVSISQKSAFLIFWESLMERMVKRDPPPEREKTFFEKYFYNPFKRAENDG